MVKRLKKASHYGIGFYVGVKAAQGTPASLAIAFLVTLVFTAYQTLEWIAIRDTVYPEMREFGVGLGVGIASVRGLGFARHDKDAKGALQRLLAEAQGGKHDR